MKLFKLYTTLFIIISSLSELLLIKLKTDNNIKFKSNNHDKCKVKK